MRTSPPFLFVLAATALLFTGCSLPMGSGLDTLEDTVTEEEVVVPVDTLSDLPPQPEIMDDTAPDTPPEVLPDLPPDTDTMPLGGFLDPCEEDEDCESGYCIDVEDATLCTVLCDQEDCPDTTWNCVENEDGAELCLPPCVPTDCAALGADCGAPEDGCGGALDCGSCGLNAACSEDFACVCVFLDCGGTCCKEDETCEAGQCTPPVCLASDATCDELDDDCDGTTDEDFVPDASCGVGACQTNNLPSECINGIVVPCKPGTPMPDDATCNDQDDDCDGATDEDYVPDSNCGVGWCKDSAAASTCQGGVETPCVPGEALGADDNCDGVDDDCDGYTDDNFVADDNCGLGACALNVTPSTCLEGTETACVPGEPLGLVDETCNGVDEDCDGIADEDYVPDDTCGIGACQTNNTPSTCVAGIEIPCQPGEPLGPDVTCDGVDDDCSGQADEDFIPDSTCGEGICQVTATPSSCTAGVESPCQPGEPLGPDVNCDGVDDDCDGDADEDAIPPCVFGDPVTGLPVTFLVSQGLATAPVQEDAPGHYLGRAVDLDLPLESGEAHGLVRDKASPSAAFTVTAGPPSTLRMITSRGTVHGDATNLRAVAEVLDGAGMPVPDETAVTFELSGFGAGEEVSGVALGQGRFAAWLQVPSSAFQSGATGTVIGSAGNAENEIPLFAAPLPAALDLAPGRVALVLPLGPILTGEDFEVPVVVNTDDDALGLYNITVAFNKQRLQLTDVAPGAAENLTAPEAGSLVAANASGEITFNGISMDPLAGIPSGPAVEVAVLHFTVPDVPGPEAQVSFSGTTHELANTLLTDIRDDSALVVHDSAGQGENGEVLVRASELRGIFLRPTDPIMIEDSAFTGVEATAPLEIMALAEDHELRLLPSEDADCLSLSPGVLEATGCVATATGPGAAVIIAEVDTLSSQASVRVIAPALPLTVEVRDDDLQYITEFDAVQETSVRVLATFDDGDDLEWTLDVTDQVGFLASGAVLVDGSGKVSAQADGQGSVTALGPLGAALGEVTLTVSGAESISVEQLHVMIPAHMDMAPLGAVSAAEAATELSLQITDLFTADGQTAPVLVHAILSDDEATGGGSRVDLTDHPDLNLISTDPGVGVIEGGVVTATGSGDAMVEAAMDTDAGTLSGAATLRVQLPPPAGVDVDVDASSLALAPGDVAATILGLPTKGQLQVIVHFQDGTSRDYTADPATHYATTSPLLQVLNLGDCPSCIPGQVSASGAGAGPGTVDVSFSDPYLASLSGSVEIEVVTHQDLVATAWEPYTPPGEDAAPETTLSFIEGTAARQRARLEVIEHFSDGSVQELSAATEVSWQIYLSGTTTPSLGVVAIEDGEAKGVGGGAVDLVATLNGHDSAPITLTVDMSEQDLETLVLDHPQGTTLAGIKDLGTAELRVIGTFADGTRDVLTGEGLVPGLLSFSSDAPFASVDPAGIATVHGNGPALLSVTVTPEFDTGADLAAPGVRTFAINLLPDVGDIDLGETSGLAHPDRDADALFVMPVRLNTGDAELGGVDLAITYDPLVLEAVDVAAGEGIPGAVFSANASLPGVIYLNASPPPGAGATGASLEVATLVFKALKGGPQVTAIGGTVVEVIDDDMAIIGPPTPRPIIAGAGDLDPPPAEIFGDANDDGAFSVGDVLFVRQVKAGAVTPNETQLAQSDIFPDGEVLVSDAYYASQTLARLTHFVKLTSTPVAGGQLLQATVTDRDQGPVTENVSVRFEVSVAENLGTVGFTLPHLATDSGVVTLGVSVPAAPGVWETTMDGLDLPEQVGVVVVVDVLNALGQVVWSTPFLSTPLVDPDAPFTPLLFVGACIPNCAGAACGDLDGCGDVCDGYCLSPDEVCVDGVCIFEGCVPVTCEDQGLDCGFGLDGCGGLLDCGGCDQGDICLGGACLPDGCDPDCFGKSCGDSDGCDGLCYGPCPYPNEVCADGACVCGGASCEGAVCGDPDGCGGICQGSCSEPNDECVDGACVCGGTICGDNCCSQAELCQGGVCVPACTPKECGDPGAECGEAPDGCGGTLSCGEACGLNQWCAPDFICECIVYECEGVCCDPMEQCINGQCGICIPDCEGKVCGDPDGCGDICMACPGENEVCANGTCVCAADCSDKFCGEDDGCGGPCEDLACEDPNAICQEDGSCPCKYVECGGVCCGHAELCVAGVCQ